MTRQPKKRPAQTTDDADATAETPEQVRRWAKELVKAAGKRKPESPWSNTSPLRATSGCRKPIGR